MQGLPCKVTPTPPIPTLLNTPSLAKAAKHSRLLRVVSWQAEMTKNKDVLLIRAVSLNAVHISWADQSWAWLTATAYRQTTQGEERRAVCQPASVNYLLCLNSAERSKAYRNTGCYNMEGPCKYVCVCVCEGLGWATCVRTIEQLLRDSITLRKMYFS